MTTKGYTHHGQHGTPTWQSWKAMKARCYTPTNASFANYGGRGIKVCKRWHLYLNFLADMGKRPTSNHTIDRIDGDGNYTPNNCRWSTKAEQIRNRLYARHLTYRGRTMALVDWERKLGLTRNLIYSRLKMGWTVAETLRHPVGYRRKKK